MALTIEASALSLPCPSFLCHQVDQVFNLRQTFEKWIRHNQPFVAVFIDFAATFDSIDRPSLWIAPIADDMHKNW